MNGFQKVIHVIIRSCHERDVVIVQRQGISSCTDSAHELTTMRTGQVERMTTVPAPEHPNLQCERMEAAYIQWLQH